MKLNDKAQKTLDYLFASGDGKPNAGGVLFGTVAIYEAGRANGMKYRVIKETFMTDNLRVGYGKYNLHPLKLESNSTYVQPQRARAAKKAVSVRKAKSTKNELTEDEKLEKLIKDSVSWEVVYDSATDDSQNV